MQNLLLHDDSQVCLKNKFSHKCLGLNKIMDTMICDYPPTFIHQHIDENINIGALRFKIILNDINSLQKNKNKLLYLIDGCKIFLINKQEQYLTCTSKGQLKFDKKTSNQQMNKLLFKTSIWTIHFWKKKNNNNNNNNTNQINIYDQICIKSVTNTYLTCFNNYQCYAKDQILQENSVWSFIFADVPSIPLWVYNRPSLSKFMNIGVRSSQIIRQKKLLKSHSAEIQQALLVEDLLDIMLGYDGIYIRRRTGTYQFGIEIHLDTPTCNIALAQLTMKILALPSYYYMLQNYISTYNIQQGIICQALCGGLRILIKEYKMMVVQLDQEVKNGLTLQKIWYFIQPSLKIMQSLIDLIKESQKLKGGQLLSCLVKMLNQNTDQQIVSIYNFLFNRAIKLYMGIICKWIYKGIVEDKHDQFMIQAQSDLKDKQNTEWDHKYHLRIQQIPSLFQKDSQMILITGKYLNVLRSCGKTIEHPYHQQIQQNIDKYITLQNFTQPINRAYQWANKQLKQLVFKEYKLIDVLKSLKGYYFLNYGDLFSYFMDAAQQQLSLPFRNKFMKDNNNNNINSNKRTLSSQYYKQFSITKINNLFELLIRTSSANNDYFKDQVKCFIDTNNLYDQIQRIKLMQNNIFQNKTNQRYLKKDSRYYDYINIDYNCVFPLNLVINHSMIIKYQVLFRFIFWLKFIQKQLNGVWLTLQATKEIQINFCRCAYQLTQKMINCVKNITYYLSYQVIQPNWQYFINRIQNVQNFQQLITNHNNFLNKCLTESMLMNNQLFPILNGQLGHSLQYFLRIKQYISHIHDGRQFIAYNIENQSALIQRKNHLKKIKRQIMQWFEQNNFKKFVNGHNKNYNQSMQKLLHTIYNLVGKKDHYLINFLIRLDQGKYYNRTLFNNNLYNNIDDQ